MHRYHGIPTDLARALRAGVPDANGQPAERIANPWQAAPCRHCLRSIPQGAEMLIFALRPFAHLQPYAETGPAFLCAAGCAAHAGHGVPPVLTSSPDYLVKGYGADERILYGTGQVVEVAGLDARVADLLFREEIAFVDIRSARNNCWQARARRV
ncbi:DUF1203 domain-containing protein [Oceanicola sp. S124]|uniref:DUF1203 domain-containing protein n=1 Tax=Oceanicola sp. S124 TaxID=1042378 RepID=UPI00025585C7|nr:DUF1203 domain-containing protein [Oceanicola sp. S124]